MVGNFVYLFSITITERRSNSMKTIIDWSKVSKEDLIKIGNIAQRAVDGGFDGKLLTLNMDLSAAHLDTPLDLDAFLTAPVSDFWHDIYGITAHMDRETGKLKDCFLPRYTRKHRIERRSA